MRILLWNDIIEHVPSKINNKLGFLRRIKAYLPVNARLTFFSGFVFRILIMETSSGVTEETYYFRSPSKRIFY